MELPGLYPMKQSSQKIGVLAIEREIDFYIPTQGCIHEASTSCNLQLSTLHQRARRGRIEAEGKEDHHKIQVVAMQAIRMQPSSRRAVCSMVCSLAV